MTPDPDQNVVHYCNKGDCSNTAVAKVSWNTGETGRYCPKHVGAKLVPRSKVRGIEVVK